MICLLQAVRRLCHACMHTLSETTQVFPKPDAGSFAYAEFAWPGTALSALEQWKGGVG